MDPSGASITLIGGEETAAKAVGQEIAQRLGRPVVAVDTVEQAPQHPGSVIVIPPEAVSDPRHSSILGQLGTVYVLTAGPSIHRSRQFPAIRVDSRTSEAVANEILNDAANRGAILPPKAVDNSIGRSTRVRKPVVALALVGLVIVAGIVAALFLRSGGGDIVQMEANGPAFDAPPGAPEADVYFDVVAVMDDSRAAQRRLESTLGFGQACVGCEVQEEIQLGTVMHIATAQSTFGPVEVYSWDMAIRFPGAPADLLSCYGEIMSQGGGEGGSSSCDDGAGQDRTQLSWGGFGDGRNWTTTIVVHNAPPEAVWMTTESRAGVRVVSSIAAGVGFTELGQRDGEPREVVLLDADGNEVWSESLF